MSELDELFINIKNSKNIYDILVSLYNKISNTNMSYSIYSKSITSVDIESHKTNFLIDSLLENIIGLNQFKYELLNLLGKNTDLLCFYILHSFIQIFEDKDEYKHFNFNSLRKIYKDELYGPMNSIKYDNYRLYLKSNANIVGNTINFNNKNTRNVNTEKGNSLFGKKSSYTIQNVTTNEDEIIIKHYGGVKFFSDSSNRKLKIAIIPFSNTKWFTTHELDRIGLNGEGYFSIEYKDEEMTTINESYKMIISKLNEDKVDIVIFPELSMNKNTKSEIQRILQTNTILNLNKHSLKLIFAGSLWDNNKNECCVLAGSGTELIANAKRNPFSYANQTNGRIMYEDFEVQNRLNLLDIDELGRILYGVCKDMLDNYDEVVLHEIFGVNIDVISAYSASLSNFEHYSNDLIPKYNNIVIVANSCCPIYLSKHDKTAIGFLSLPSVNTQNQLCKSAIKYYSLDNICIKSCSFCKCAYIYEINFDKIVGLDNICVGYSCALCKIKI